MDSIRIANAPVSWGVIEETPGERLGGDQVLDEIAASSYAGTELGDWGFLPTNAVELSEALEKRGLALIGSWLDFSLETEEELRKAKLHVVRLANLLAEVGGKDAIIVLGNSHSKNPNRAKKAGRIKPEDGLDEEGWARFAEGVNQIAGEAKRETGLKSAFHHHCATWVETPEETERLLALTDPSIVGLCLDTGHYAFGGGDPVEGLRKHADRLRLVHFKDCNPGIAGLSRTEGWDYITSIGNGVFSELGKGDIEFPIVLDLLDEIGYEGWIVVEQDVLPGMGSPFESAKRNRAYLTKLGV